MIRFTTTILKFDKKGEKTGWSYIEISAHQARKLKPGTKTSFRVKGTLDNYSLRQTALVPMGDGKFILPINGAMRKGTGKKQGDKLKVMLEWDESKFVLSPDFIACLKDDPAAWAYFKTLPGAHQRYFSKWIDSAKTMATKTKRIVIAVNAIARKYNYGQMLRAQKGN